MGISSAKSKTTPVYSKQIEAGAGSLTDAYNRSAPRIEQVSDQLSGLVPGLVQRFNQGDKGVNAARDYNTDVLSGRYMDGNPHLEEMLANSNNDIKNQLQSALGVRGLTGGSSYADIISRNIANNTLSTRYQNWDAERGRMATAAGMSPGLAAADYLPLASALGVGETANDPLQAAVGYSSGLGGLLGQYTKTKSKSPWGPALLGALSSVASAYAGGG